MESISTQSITARKCGFVFKVRSTEETVILIIVVIRRDQAQVARARGFVKRGLGTLPGTRGSVGSSHPSVGPASCSQSWVGVGAGLWSRLCP